MDNITHSLIGLATAKYANDKFNKKEDKKLKWFFIFMALFAANFPDLDLIMGFFEKGIIGYLSHHRGHTHTFVLLIPQVLVLLFLGSFLFKIKEKRVQWVGLVLIGLNMVLHILMDMQNFYGVHPFWPFSNHWYYSDTLFIIEPLIWFVLLPLILTWDFNASNWKKLSSSERTQKLAGLGFLIGLFLGVLYLAYKINYISSLSLWLCIVLFLILDLIYFYYPSRSRTYASFILFALIICAFSLGRNAAFKKVNALHTSQNKENKLFDVALNPMPAHPFCWSFLAVVAQGKSSYSVQHGFYQLSNFFACPDQIRQQLNKDQLGVLNKKGLVVHKVSSSRIEPLTKSLPPELECKRQAWLQFVRVPFPVSSNHFVDLRFQRSGNNFTEMHLQDPEVKCLKFKVPWVPPRQDLLSF